MTADADRPSAGNVALVRKYLEKHGVTSTEDGRIVIATLLEKVSKKHDDFCNEMAERIEAATASQRKRIDALTAREAALLARAESAEADAGWHKAANAGWQRHEGEWNAERDALAAQVGVLREALEAFHKHGVRAWTPREHCELAERALADTAASAAAFVEGIQAEQRAKMAEWMGEWCYCAHDDGPLKCVACSIADALRRGPRPPDVPTSNAPALSPGTADAGEP